MLTKAFHLPSQTGPAVLRKEMNREETQIRLRPSYFPFTDLRGMISHAISVKAQDAHLQIHRLGRNLGCGMVDPRGSANAISSGINSGYAFGMGIETQHPAQYRVRDLRLFFENDMRFPSVSSVL
jgi:phenylalanyl-tRNA synthetase alpha chain